MIGVDRLDMTPVRWFTYAILVVFSRLLLLFGTQIQGMNYIKGTVGTKDTLDAVKRCLGGRKADVVGVQQLEQNDDYYCPFVGSLRFNSCGVG